MKTQMIGVCKIVCIRGRLAANVGRTSPGLEIGSSSSFGRGAD